MRRPPAVTRDIYPASDRAQLDASGGPFEQHVLLAGATSNVTAWRLVELFSDKGLPWEADISWTGATATGARAQITVSGGSARFCMAAMAVQSIAARNRSNEAQMVRVSVASLPGPVTCYNQFLDVSVMPGGGLSLSPPPYATKVFIVPQAQADIAATTVELYDGNQLLVGQYLLAQQPAGGEPIVGIRTVKIIGVAGHRYATTWFLGV